MLHRIGPTFQRHKWLIRSTLIYMYIAICTLRDLQSSMPSFWRNRLSFHYKLDRMVDGVYKESEFATPDQEFAMAIVLTIIVRIAFHPGRIFGNIRWVFELNGKSNKLQEPKRFIIITWMRIGLGFEWSDDLVWWLSQLRYTTWEHGHHLYLPAIEKLYKTRTDIHRPSETKRIGEDEKGQEEQMKSELNWKCY